jgi:DMSO/TMAO reductase YedYZ molybdopterin-dependent catalytic subunit
VLCHRRSSQRRQGAAADAPAPSVATAAPQVRNHLPVPQVDGASYRLHIEGEGLRTLSLSLEDLKTKFRKHSVASTIM